MRTIIFNQSNVVAGRNNSTLTYNFPNSVDLTGAQIAISNVFMYYAWFNISAALRNNTYQYTVQNNTGTLTRTVVMPDGMYNITDINAYLQFAMIANNDYLITSTGSYVYFAEFLVNPTQYVIQINTFSIYTTAEATALGYTLPSAGFGGGAGTLPALNPQARIILTSGNDFYKIIGFADGFSTTATNTAPGGSDLSFLSSTTPQVQPNPNLLISITGIDNKYSSPSTIIYSLAPNVGFGELISERPAQFNFNKFLAGTYNQLTLQFLGSNFQPISIEDPNITVICVIRDRDDLVDDVGAGVSSTSSSQLQQQLSRSGANQASRLSLSGGGNAFGWR
jgi:hypothetical protein